MSASCLVLLPRPGPVRAILRGTESDTPSWSAGGIPQSRSENPQQFPRTKARLCSPWPGPSMSSKHFLQLASTRPPLQSSAHRRPALQHLRTCACIVPSVRNALMVPPHCHPVPGASLIHPQLPVLPRWVQEHLICAAHLIWA